MIAADLILGTMNSLGACAASSLSTAQVDSVSLIDKMDSFILGMGLALSVVLAVFWAIFTRRDPLVRSPQRPNKFMSEMVFVAVIAYLFVGYGAASLLGISDAPSGQEAEDNTALVSEVGQSDHSDGDATGLVGQGAISESQDGTLPTQQRSLSLLVTDTAGRVACLLVCFVLASKWFDGGLRRFLFGEFSIARDLSWAFVASIVVLALCDITARATVFSILLINPDYVVEPHRTIQALSDSSFPFGVVLAFQIGAGLLAPLAEEVFFRGLLQTMLSNALRSRWVSIVIVSILFSFAHSQGYAMPALFVLSVIIGVTYERTGSLLGPILIHVIFNCKTLLWLHLGA